MLNKSTVNPDQTRRLRGRATRSISVGTKLTAAEFEPIEAASSSSCKTVGEWLRDVALKTVDASPESEKHTLLLSEVIGIRLLVVNVLRSVATGQIMAPESFDKMLDEIGRAKYELARKLLSEGKK